MFDRIKRRNRYVETGEHLVKSLQQFSLILDLGCGENLYSDVPGVIGVDLDSPHANVHADIRKLPYENNSVDCVLAFGSLVFGDREERTLLDGEQLLLEQLQEIFRVLKPSGMFYGRSRYLTVINNSSLTSYEQLFGATRLCSKIIKHTTKNEERIYWEWKKI